MRIEINPRSLLNLENICEVLYKLDPSVLDYLVEMERSLGKVLGFIDMDNPSLEEREFLSNNFSQTDYSSEPVLNENLLISSLYKDYVNPYKITEEDSKSKLLKAIEKLKYDLNWEEFNKLRKYIQLDTYEYVPIKIYVEVEDPIIGKKVCELVRALEKTRAPEQFYMNKKEIDEDAYFAEGYNFKMNEEQKKKHDDIFNYNDVEALKKLLIKENLYP